MDPTPSTPLSPRVQLEVAFLDADQVEDAPDRSQATGEHPYLTVLVVAAEPDVRRYVRECLRERPDLLLVEAASVAAAIAIATHGATQALIVDAHEAEVVAVLAHIRGVVLVDEVPRTATPSGARLRLLARPFTAAALVAELDQLLEAPLR